MNLGFREEHSEPFHSYATLKNDVFKEKKWMFKDQIMYITDNIWIFLDFYLS